MFLLRCHWRYFLTGRPIEVDTPGFICTKRGAEREREIEEIKIINNNKINKLVIFLNTLTNECRGAWSRIVGVIFVNDF